MLTVRSHMSVALLDRRTTAARADLAAEHLRGFVDAPRYAEGRGMRIIAASAPLRRSPEADAPLETEALHGESVAVYDQQGAWAWAQLERDQYVGYLPSGALGAPSAPTHRVAALRTHAYPGAAIKLPPRMALSLGSQLTIVGRGGDFAVSQDGLYVWSRCLAELGAREPDYVAVAELFLETPYLWGGRTSEGIDCSGLVQTALTAAGVASPRDSDMQEATLGKAIAIDDPRSPLARGDLIFWKGHVGIMRDPVTLLHANGWHMKTVSEPLAQACERIAANGGGKVTSVRRLSARD
jgi:cell wall-associated NlpC family hydrolase